MTWFSSSGIGFPGWIQGQGGLLTLRSTAQLRLDSPAIVSNRIIAIGADPRTAPSIEDSDDILIEAPDVQVADNVQILAFAD